MTLALRPLIAVLTLSFASGAFAQKMPKAPATSAAPAPEKDQLAIWR